ncbi:MAG: efflux RND transporter periplasmic adaptor subunit [Chakrabartia sp.]
MRLKSVVIAAAIAGAIALAAVFLLGLGRGSSSAQRPADILVVDSQKARADNGEQMVAAVGTVAARRELSLGFTTAGQIRTITVNEGDRVRKGQLLAALDSDQVASALAAAEAEARRARAEYQRAVDLRAQGWVTQIRVDNARAAQESALAAVQARRFAVDTARIVAPNDGLVLARLAEPNEVVAAGSPVVVVGDAGGGFVLRVPLSDRQSAQIVKGAAAEVRLDAFGDRPIKGQVIEVGSQSDRATGAFQIEIGLPDLPGLRSGLTGRAAIQSAANAALPSTQVIIDPLALFSARAGEGFVYVIDAKRRARVRKVRLGEARDDGLVILSGLAAGEEVITSGLDRLRDGTPVQTKATRP